MSDPTNDDVEAPEDPVTVGDQSELDLGVIATGDAVVDTALGGLAQLDSMPVADHPAVFEEIHRGLSQAMSSASQEPTDDPSSSNDEVADGSPER